MQLFEIEDISVHADGNRARSLNDQRRVTRLLKGFGPCMIVAEELPECACTRFAGLWTSYSTAHRLQRIRYRNLMYRDET